MIPGFDCQWPCSDVTGDSLQETSSLWLSQSRQLAKTVAPWGNGWTTTLSSSRYQHIQEIKPPDSIKWPLQISLENMH